MLESLKPSSRLLRLAALIMPTVTVFCREKGLPTATTNSPVRRSEDWPRCSTGRGVCSKAQHVESKWTSPTWSSHPACVHNRMCHVIVTWMDTWWTWLDWMDKFYQCIMMGTHRCNSNLNALLLWVQVNNYKSTFEYLQLVQFWWVQCPSSRLCTSV